MTAHEPLNGDRFPSSGVALAAPASGRDRAASGVRIGEVARRLGVSPSTLRAWERRGLVTPLRGAGRHRRYADADIERLHDVRALRSRGYGARALRSLIAGDAIEPATDVGSRLRAARTRRGMTLRTAAERAAVSVSYLSLVERGLAEPSVSLLRRVTAAYGGTLLEFFGDRRRVAPGRKLVRAHERARLQGFDRVEIEDLVAVPAAQLEVNIFRIAPGGGSGGDYSHDGEEAIFVLEGALDVWLDDDEHHVMQRGDTLWFPSTQRHRWTNQSDGETLLFWVNTPPTF